MERKKVLIVEDDEAVCHYTREIVERQGWQALIALNTDEAWEIFQGQRPQGCIIDIHMPFSQFDGMEFLRRIRRMDKETKCVIFTCVDEQEKGEEARELGVVGYFVKPIDFEGMRELINKLR